MSLYIEVLVTCDGKRECPATEKVKVHVRERVAHRVYPEYRGQRHEQVDVLEVDGVITPPGWRERCGFYYCPTCG